MSDFRIPLHRSLLLALCVNVTACAGVTATAPSRGAPADGIQPHRADERVCSPAGAEGIAAQVARELPSAIAQVAAAHGRSFPLPVQVDVCGDLRSFARFSPTLRAAAVMDGERVVLSPRIEERPERLRGLVVHELSHLHLVQHLGLAKADRLPIWFREGLAVFVSDGAGAERVSVPEAEFALVNGPCMSLDGGQELTFPLGASDPDMTPHMFYRQAGMFVAFLAERDRGAFARLLGGILDGLAFDESFQAAYGGTTGDLFREWADGIAKGLHGQ